ncbi:GDP-L-fucose synthase [Polynucleobacter sp. UB-Siik-W21]|uniref:GDP-L-fucose synthase family protein n=1 Tax=Polynucleobacter sp. UB-Siik-W21 TaxID=1855646 RepID=UPI001BFDAFA0|nr:GDP-L-fucose synthase [Polynucleobacter sp. UB-Siik-W21]QWD70689.1 GDP-L-fucose synthase [Polynucleobacter sp. UB-Siik-W21]
MDKNLKQKIYVAGHRGMAGSAIVRGLKERGYQNIITRSRSELDLTNQAAVANFFATEKPDQVYVAAAKVGGIYANSTFPAEFIYQNLIIEANVIHQAFVSGVKKLLFLGSSCIYPKLAEQPMSEEALLSSRLEETNEPYAVSKIAGLKLCESYSRQYGKEYGVDYRSIMPTNLYGPGDNYHPLNSHVIPALIRRVHEAKVNGDLNVTIWGTGTPRREFMYVNDMAGASIFVMELEKDIYEKYTTTTRNFLNVGYGSDVTIKELVDIIVKVIGYQGGIVFDGSKPDGAPRKFMNSQRLFGLGWKPNTDLEEGIKNAYSDFVVNIDQKESK